MAELHPGIWFKLYARRVDCGAREEKGTFDTLDAACESGDALLDDGYYEYFVHDAKDKKVQHVCGAEQTYPGDD